MSQKPVGSNHVVFQHPQVGSGCNNSTSLPMGNRHSRGSGRFPEAEEKEFQPTSLALTPSGESHNCLPSPSSWTQLPEAGTAQKAGGFFPFTSCPEGLIWLKSENIPPSFHSDFPNCIILAISAAKGSPLPVLKQRSRVGSLSAGPSLLWDVTPDHPDSCRGQRGMSGSPWADACKQLLSFDSFSTGSSEGYFTRCLIWNTEMKGREMKGKH